MIIDGDKTLTQKNSWQYQSLGRRCPQFSITHWLCVLMVTLSWTLIAKAQDLSLKQSRIVTIEAGGGNDTVARLVAQGLNQDGGGRFIVENHGGANGVVAIQTVIKAPPDGLTLLSISSSLWTLPLMQSLPYEPLKDLTPIILVVSSPNVLVVNPSLPVKNVRELIAFAKTHPGELNYSTAGSGSSGHLSAELFKSMASVDMVKVSYKGGVAAMTDLIGGQVQVSFTSTGSAAAHVQSGRLRALALTSAFPSKLFPGLPTIASEGLSGYELSSVYGIFAPAHTSPLLVERINQRIARAIVQDPIKALFFKAGCEVVASSSQEFEALIQSDVKKLSKLVRDARIRVD